MTIDSSYAPESFALNPTREYTFTFEHTGKETVIVSWLLSDDTFTRLSVSQYSIVNGPLSGDSLYDGGQVTITAADPATAVQVIITRSTPISQLVDYQPYSPFPAETTEFTIDKITLILQELQANGVIAGDEGDYVPLIGTLPGSPIIGPLIFDAGLGGWTQQQGDFSGLNLMTVNANTGPSAMSITTISTSAEQHSFQFTQDGQLYIPSFGEANNEVWVIQGSDFLGTENALGVYSFDQNTNLRTENPIFFYTSGTQALSIGIDGKAIQTGVVEAGDNDQALATKLYVDAAVAVFRNEIDLLKARVVALGG
jgi:hypothetical protein